MHVVPTILAWNVYTTGRLAHFHETVDSIRAAGLEPIVVTNGSTDGTDRLVREFPKGIVENSNSKMWWGCTVAILAAIDEGADIVMFSADDIRYHDGFLPKLQAFWSEAPDDLVLAGLFLEPEWDWNTPTGVVEYGGVKGLVRPSVPSASWTFRARDWPIIRDRRTGTVFQQSPGEDHETCKRLLAEGYTLVHLDLADHIGEQQSAWGNQSWRYARPLDREKWGI